MSELYAEAPTLLITIAIGYLLGALPLADVISRRHGIDIFSEGTGLAGSTNVRRIVGPLPGLVVLLGDLGKGALAVLVADFMGVEGPWTLLPAAGAIVGHWKSVFTGLRGGDGLATLGGSLIALFPVEGTISVTIALVVALGAQRMPVTSLLSIVFGYGTLVALTVGYGGDTTLAAGSGGLCGLVLAYALLGHHRRRGGAEWEDVEDANGAPEQSR